MPNITLPDGKKISFDEKINGIQIAEKISKSLSKQALIISVDGELKDLNLDIEKDCLDNILKRFDKLRHTKGKIKAGQIRINMQKIMQKCDFN